MLKHLMCIQESISLVGSVIVAFAGKPVASPGGRRVAAGPRGDQSSRSRSAGNSLLELSKTWRNVPMQGALVPSR